MFVHETIEYDRSQPFDVRDTSDAGVGYRLIKTDLTTLIGRLGGGFSHEYGGPENGQYIPEAVFGLQLDCQLSKRQKLLGAVEYAPDVGDFLRYRIRTASRVGDVARPGEEPGFAAWACWNATIAIRRGPAERPRLRHDADVEVLTPYILHPIFPSSARARFADSCLLHSAKNLAW